MWLLSRYAPTPPPIFILYKNQNFHISSQIRVEDAAGNYMTYEYDPTDHLITRITYTGNVRAPVSPTNTIVFEYGQKTDQYTIYEAGEGNNTPPSHNFPPP